MGFIKFGWVTAITVLYFFFGDWVPFKGDGCKIEFPGTPTSQVQSVKTALGDLTMNIHMYEVPAGATDDNFLYGLIDSEYPDSVINSDKKELLDQFFRKSVDGAVSNVHGQLLTEQTIGLEGYPGRDIRVNYQQGVAVIRMRFYLVRNRLFLLQTITDPKKESNPSIGRFFDSFSLLR